MTTTTRAPLPVRDDRRVAETLAFLCSHVTVWEQRDQTAALEVYLHTTVPDDSRANLKQYRDFSGAVRAAVVILRTPGRHAAVPTAAQPAPACPEPWQCPSCHSLVDDEPAGQCADCRQDGTAEPQASSEETQYIPSLPFGDGSRVVLLTPVPAAVAAGPDPQEGQWLRDINAELGTGDAHDEGTSAVAPGTPGPGPGHTTAEKAPGSAEPPAPAPPAGVDTTSAGPGVPSETSTGDGSGQAEADPLPVGKWDKPGKDGAQS